MPKRVIIAFCRLNLSLVAETQALLAEAKVAESQHAVVQVRCLRCLARCFTCSGTAYVRVDNEVLGAPDPEALKQQILKAVDQLNQAGAGEASPARPVNPA